MSFTYDDEGLRTSKTVNGFTTEYFWYGTRLVAEKNANELILYIYDANTCRFINADGYISTGQGLLGYNMFAYCNNNPVNAVDYSGNIPGMVMVCIHGNYSGDTLWSTHNEVINGYDFASERIYEPKIYNENRLPSILVRITINDSKAHPILWDQYAEYLVNKLENEYSYFFENSEIDINQFAGEIQFHLLLYKLGVFSNNANPIDINIYANGTVKDDRFLVNYFSHKFSQRGYAPYVE